MNKLILLILLLSTSSVFAASKGTGTIADLKWNAINFCVLFGFLGWKLKKPISKMFDKNAEEVTAIFNSAEEKDKEAQIRFNEFQKKLSNVEAEKSKILTEANENAETFSKEHVKEIDGLIGGLRADAITRIESEKTQMTRNLNSTLLDEVISKVKAQISGDKTLQDKATKKLVSQI